MIENHQLDPPESKITDIAEDVARLKQEEDRNKQDIS